MTGVGDGDVGDHGMWVWLSWWLSSRLRFCSRLDDKVMSWSEVCSLGSESSTLGAELVGCSWALHHEYRGLFCDMEWWRTIMMIASWGNFDLLLHLVQVEASVDSIEQKFVLRVVL